jgi:hypothetical protein
VTYFESLWAVCSLLYEFKGDQERLLYESNRRFSHQNTCLVSLDPCVDIFILFYFIRRAIHHIPDDSL